MTAEAVERTVADSGLRIVTERMSEARSVCLGIYAEVGSRDEPVELSGASHFLEHLLFKGTPRRSAREIATAVDAVGGEMNAFTARETTAYYTRMPAASLDLGLDLLCDVVTEPAFRPHEVDAEREVILEEILMSEDDPDDVTHRLLWESLFPEHPLGRETLGSAGTVSAISRDQIAGFHQDRYHPGSLVVAAAGDLEHDRVVDAVLACFTSREPVAFPERTVPGTGPVPLAVVERPTEQVHLAIGWPSLDAYDDDRYALAVANHILGGGMASRLFQAVREERGLAYAVGSSTAMYRDAGALVLSVGTAPSRLAELVEVLDDEVESLLTDGVTEDEHRVALGYLEGATVLGLEDSGSRMVRLAGEEILRGEVTSIEEHLRRLRAVTPDDATRVLRRVLDAPRSVAATGPFASDDPSLARASSWRRAG